VSRVRFGSFTVDLALHQLSRRLGGDETHVRLSAAETAILERLLWEEGVVHSKETLLAVGWQGRPVSANSLPVAIANLRRQLQAAPPELEIRTLPRQGYLLKLIDGLRVEQIADEETDAPAPPVDAPPAPPAPPAKPNPATARSVRSRRRLIWLNVLTALATLIFVLVTTHEWVPVACAQEARGALCVVDDAERESSALELPTDAAQRLIVASGDAWMALQRGKPSPNRPVSEPARGW
jgi:DNA-binding winged helix-turn-helix (wHTH) protein